METHGPKAPSGYIFFNLIINNNNINNNILKMFF